MSRVAVLAALVCSIVGLSMCAAEAWAAPEYMECVKAKGGAFEKGCGKEGGEGGFKREALAAPVKVTGTGGKFVYKAFDPETKTIVAVESCTKSKWTGELTGPRQSEFVATLEGCSSLGRTCTGVENKEGDATFKLDGELVATDEANSGVGVRLTGAESPNIIAQENCEGIKRTFEGVVTAEAGAGDIEKASKDSEFILQTNEEGLPAIATEGSHETLFQTITGASPESITEPTGFEDTTKLKGSKEIIVVG
jgi:hypothetical protein